MTDIKTAVEDMMNDMSKPPAVASGDWRDEEGLLICGVCGEPKETKVQVLGLEETVACMCKCQTEAYARRQEEWKESQRRFRVQHLREIGMKNLDLHGCCFENAQETIYIQKCKQFVEHWDDIRKENCGLLMYGSVGNGKTYASACIANALMEKGVPVLMTSIPEIMNTSRYDITEFVRASDEFDLIVLDDLGAERDTEYATEIVYYFIDNRYRAKKPMIVTTNLSLKDIQSQTEMRYKRIYDRILEMCLPMKFEGESKRVAKKEEKAKLLREIINGR